MKKNHVCCPLVVAQWDYHIYWTRPVIFSSLEILCTSVAFSIYDCGFCLRLCIQQGYSGDPGPPGPQHILNGSDARGETTAVATLS